MAGTTNKSKSKQLTKINDIKFDKIGVFFKRSTLKNILSILTMEHAGFRTYKSVKNINRLFNNIDLDKYKNHKDLESYIWAIKYFSKQWVDGVIDPDTIAELAKRDPEYDNLKGEIIEKSINDKEIITTPEAKAIFDLVGESLQCGFVVAMKDEYISLLDDIDMESPGALRELLDRLFMVSQSLIDIKHNTNMIPNKFTLNTSDLQSLRNALSETIISLRGDGNMLKLGIRRWNTLLSPAYMNGRLYVYAGAAGSGKSIVLEKTAMDIRKYNPNYKTKTPGMRPCVLYVVMENTFIETIERMWNMEFDDSITNYTEEQALDKLCKVLGINRVLKEDVTVRDEDGNSLVAQLEKTNDENEELNIEIVMKYFSYREISTDDLFTLIQDLREENMEVCALVFDYIKRIRPAEAQADNVKLELNRIMNELKALAVICDIPVITAHQLNRTGASVIDNAIRQGDADGIKHTGREHIGDAWEVVEVADWLGLCNIVYKPGTDQRYLTLNVIKRRRIDMADADLAKYTYLAHPFSKTNGLRLIDDLYLDKVLSLQSLNTDIVTVSKERTNAVPRAKLPVSEFDLDDDYN